jgi:hypothetical protein
VVLSLYHDRPSSHSLAASFRANDVLARLKVLDSRAQRKGLDSLDPSKNPLIGLGMELDQNNRVQRNCYGVFHLSWRAQKDGDWHHRIERELQQIRDRIRLAHGSRLRFLIWAGMGGSAEDKSMYNAAGLLSRGPRCYVLDSTDPAKLKHILEDMQRRSGLDLKEVLKSTLVVGMALGMTSYEPVVNLQAIHRLYRKCRLDGAANFLYMTLPGSLLDRFGVTCGYDRLDLQLDQGHTTAGRHSSPLTRGSLYPLGLAGVDLKQWIAATFLGDDEIQTAWQLAAFLHRQGMEGRDKVTLLLPKLWLGAGLWTKQNFEESLGKSEDTGIKIVIDEKIKLANYRSPKDGHQDRVFLAFQRKGLAGPDRDKLSIVRRAGYPLASVILPPAAPLSAYMQFIHYTVFGLAWLRRMNFVTQPSVELYKTITARIHAAANKHGGIEHTRDWQRMKDPSRTLRYRAGISLHLPYHRESSPHSQTAAPAAYAGLIQELAADRRVEYAELSFFGDTRFNPRGRAMRKCLDRAAEIVFRARMKMPVDVYEGPAMNHSYHEMIIGHGRCFSTVLLSEKAESIPDAGYSAGYHRAQFLATQLALTERGRPVVAILVKDLEETTLRHLDEFFRAVAAHLK